MIIKKVQKTIREYNLFEKKDRILIAYSGGADSTGLLSVLMELREEWSFELFLGHFNHKLRKKAGEDEQFVKQVARNYSLPLYIRSKDIHAYAREEGMNIEEAGRKLRYEFFRKTAVQIGGAKIATGHTMNDQAETLLMRLMRGSGLRGLAGIFPVVDGKIVRPLIAIERKEIEAYLKKRGIEFCVDESNSDLRFLRNRIRLKLIPSIQKNFELRIIPHLGKIASIIREEDCLLDQLTHEKVQRVILKESKSISLDLNPLFSLPLALRRRAVREFLSELRGNLRRISFEDIESILSLKEGKEFTLKKNLVLRREQGLISSKEEKPSKVKYDHMWRGDAPLEIEGIALKFEGDRLIRTRYRNLNYDDNTGAFLDLAKLKFPLLVRNRREGDRYQPLGAPGQKKLKEIMRARGIPLSKRERHPVFLSGEDIVWVFGLPVSEKFKITKETKEIFVISVSLIAS